MVWVLLFKIFLFLFKFQKHLCYYEKKFINNQISYKYISEANNNGKDFILILSQLLNSNNIKVKNECSNVLGSLSYINEFRQLCSDNNIINNIF